MGWIELAACAGLMPIDVFFPARGQTAAVARAICSTCKVQPACLSMTPGPTLTRWDFGADSSERERRHHGQVA